MKDTFKILHALHVKSTGAPSTILPKPRRMTPEQAGAINLDVLRLASVEWRPVEKGKGAREALKRSAK